MIERVRRLHRSDDLGGIVEAEDRLAIGVNIFLILVFGDCLIAKRLHMGLFLASLVLLSLKSFVLHTLVCPVGGFPFASIMRSRVGQFGLV